LKPLKVRSTGGLGQQSLVSEMEGPSSARIQGSHLRPQT
jgi:hypothetical protein